MVPKMPMRTPLPAPRVPAPHESALYTWDMLETLKKIALQQNQHLLAHLLDLAAMEAKTLGESQDQDTLFPG